LKEDDHTWFKEKFKITKTKTFIITSLVSAM